MLGCARRLVLLCTEQHAGNVRGEQKKTCLTLIEGLLQKTRHKASDSQTMDTLQEKGDPLINSSAFPKIKEEEDMESSYTDNSGQEFSTQSDVFDHIKTEDSSNSYGSVKEGGDSNKQGGLVYNPDTLLWIKRVDGAELTTDDDLEAKEPQMDVPSLKERLLKWGASSGNIVIEKEVKRRPRFTAAEEFVLVTELLEHYHKLFGERARMTPFAQKVSIWQKVLDNVNSVGVVQRGIEEAKKHWHLYENKLLEKLVTIQKQTSGSRPGRSLLVQLTPLESKLANLFKVENMLRSVPQPPMVQHSLGSQDGVDVAGNKRRGSLYEQNIGDQGVGSLGHGDYSHIRAARNIKFSFDENCALVHEAVGVWDSIIGRNAATTSQARKNFLWSRIVEAVNAAGSQPRSGDNCKKRLRDIKRRVKAKMADQCNYSQQNGSGPGLELQYLSYEEELMHIIGPDTVRPIDGHVDTDREPRPSIHPSPTLIGFSSCAAIGQQKEGKLEPEEEAYYEEEYSQDFWNHSLFDMAEEEEDDDKGMVPKMEPINYSADVLSPSAQAFPGAVQPVSVATQSSHLHPVSTKPVVFTAKPPVVLGKPPPVGTRPFPVVSRPLPITNKPNSVASKPSPLTNPPSSLTTPTHQPNPTDTGTINKVVGTFHSAQRNYHRSQRHQMHVIHMDLLHLGVGVQQLTRNIKVHNHVRATARTRDFRLKRAEIEEQRQFRVEKLRLLKEHHEAKQRIRQEHYEKKEKLLQENNQILQGIIHLLANPTGSLLANASSATPEEIAPCVTTTPSNYHVPSPIPQNSDRPLTNIGVSTTEGKSIGGT
ncbi:uncharacterized protein LOC142101921 [Mixophyes fleayi]|uniref:uncharacterized protein LOC142101921 n=1 Tax=Mixophyes fleayi TaxID=3061075 RepID=UPI003F4DC353